MLTDFLKNLNKSLQTAVRYYLVLSYKERGYETFRQGLQQEAGDNPVPLEKLRERSDTINHKLLKLPVMGDQRYKEIHAGIVSKSESLKGTSKKEFSDLFDTKRNDFIYGCYEARIAYTDLFATSEQRLSIDHQRYLKVDTYNDTTWRHEGIKETLVLPSSAARRLGIVAKHLGVYREAVTKRDKQESLNFYHCMENHPKYSPQRINSAFSTGDKAELQSISRDKKSPLDSDELAAYNKQTRRACKFGIEYALGQGRHVHFILDGLLESIDAAISKKISTSDRIFITVSELLYVKRNWYKIEKTGRLHFYLGGFKVPAPWAVDDFDTESIFATYEFHRLEKYFSIVPNAAEIVLDIIKTKSPSLYEYIVKKYIGSKIKKESLLAELKKLPIPVISYLANKLRDIPRARL